MPTEEPQMIVKMPRGLSEQSVRELLTNDLCPMCIGELDTGFECNKCGYDAIALVRQLGVS